MGSPGRSWYWQGLLLYSDMYVDPVRPANFARFVLLSPRARTFFGELSTRSQQFRTRWAAHNVRHHHTARTRLHLHLHLHHHHHHHHPHHHPVVGDLDLTYEVMELPADPGLSLVVYGAEAGSPSRDAVRLLASWAATLEQPNQPDQLDETQRLRRPSKRDRRACSQPAGVGRGAMTLARQSVDTGPLREPSRQKFLRRAPHRRCTVLARQARPPLVRDVPNVDIHDLRWIGGGPRRHGVAPAVGAPGLSAYDEWRPVPVGVAGDAEHGLHQSSPVVAAKGRHARHAVEKLADFVKYPVGEGVHERLGTPASASELEDAVPTEQFRRFEPGMAPRTGVLEEMKPHGRTPAAGIGILRKVVRATISQSHSARS